MSDVVRDQLEHADWSPAARAASLDSVFGAAIKYARGIEAWYARHRAEKRLLGRYLRMAAIVLGIIAAILPLLAQIYTDNGNPDVDPAWASVALALAAGLIALDKFFGFSAAWGRFMATELAIGHLRQDFEYEWEERRAAWPTEEPVSEDEVKEALASVRAFVAKLNTLIEGETKAWIAEFQTALSQIEKQARETK